MSTNFNRKETPKIDDLYHEIGLMFPGEVNVDVSEIVGAMMQLCLIVKEQGKEIERLNSIVTRWVN